MRRWIFRTPRATSYERPTYEDRGLEAITGKTVVQNRALQSKQRKGERNLKRQKRLCEPGTNPSVLLRLA